MLSYQKVVSEGLRDLAIIKEDQIQEALRLQKRGRQRLGQVLVELGFISNENIAKSLISQFGIEPLKIGCERISPTATEVKKCFAG